MYSEFAFYSPILDSEALRISSADDKGSEFFAIVPKPGMGKSLRIVREAALAAIESAMESGLNPGEVKVKV